MTTQIKPLKKYGQNFLQNEYYAKRIVDSLDCKENDIILEIGAGKGVLTEFLVQKKYNKLIITEIDQRLTKLLEEKYSTNLIIIRNSILNIPFEQLAEGNRIKVIGNIPYNITSDIIFKLVDNYKYIKRAVLMVQKELAHRLVANTKTKDYGILTILVGFHSKIQHLFDVNRSNFYPVPNVDSSVVCLDFYTGNYKNFNYTLFQKIVKTGFNARRKMLRNSLKSLLISNKIDEIFSISLERRPEELTIEDFKKLTNEISTKMVRKS